MIRIVGLSARLTRLVTTDVITEDLRAWVLERLTYDRRQLAEIRAHRAAVDAAAKAGDQLPTLSISPALNPRASRLRLKLAKLITCRWCSGVWIAAAVVLADRHLGHRGWWRAGSEAATAAYAVGFLATRERD